MNRVTRLLRFWFTFDGYVDRRTYFRHGVLLMALKYAGDVLIVRSLAGVWWEPADYLASVDTLFSGRLPLDPDTILALVAWTLPFLWTGVTMTVRRLIDAGLSGWFVLAFFVPFVNYGLMVILAVLRTAAKPQTPRVVETATMPPAWTAGAAGLLVGAAMIAFAVTLARSYSLALFVGTPFAMGAITAFVLNRRHHVSRASTAFRSLIMLLMASALTLLLGAEGLVCILMVMPLAVPVVLLGAEMGRAIAASTRGPAAGVLPALLVLPLAGVLPGAADGPVSVVRTSIDIDARPAEVWRSVIAFQPIPPPSEWLFRAGIAYPRYARIEGTGVGAVRYCVFSTGAFVEPITAWDEDRRLAFDVVSSPPPLRELSLYSIAPPHIDGYLRSRRGEFLLVALPGGRTRLEGTTQYELRMAPAIYWRIWGDWIIGRIHRRVLEHIRAEAEARPAGHP